MIQGEDTAKITSKDTSAKCQPTECRIEQLTEKKKTKREVLGVVCLYLRIFFVLISSLEEFRNSVYWGAMNKFYTKKTGAGKRKKKKEAHTHTHTHLP